ncbi:MAG TPA: hypothetical protein VFV73_40295 [Streptosporangiaceae bacterium]|nr:hypothetical protein [Streptosporangiaceae bacterium]
MAGFERQLDALNTQSIPDDGIFVGKKTCAATHREGLRKMLVYARPVTSTMNADVTVWQAPVWQAPVS